jgi:Rod binding domain-containing protein
MSDFNVNKTSPDFMISGMESLRGPKAKTMAEEKQRLKKATQEFESFFTYQMLKTMRQTVPESPFAKDSPLSADAGKETFTDIFDLEIARKMSSGKAESISDLLYKSLEKIVQSEYESTDQKKIQIKPRFPEKDTFIRVKEVSVPIKVGDTPIPLEKPGNGHIGLRFQNETDSAQDLNKKPKAPAQSDDKEIK